MAKATRATDGTTPKKRTTKAKPAQCSRRSQLLDVLVSSMQPRARVMS